ncbi:MAG: site-specific DNA-methyltransferase [Cyanobacteria bacterium REEB65]|nr:site-specific DNA-methyltransferase [Cyanobacteria bacterium REEB65]
MVIAQERGADWAIYNSDCIEMMRGLPENSAHYSIFSPPFASLYTFSDDPRDVSNNSDDRVFWDHYRYVIEGVFRALKPGRMISIHCMDLPTSITRDGFIGMRDFPGENIRLCQDVGFIYHSRVCIRKDPVSAMQRTKAIGLLHKQVVKDSALSRMAIADHIVTLRKPGDNDEPVSGIFDVYYGDDQTDEELTVAARQTWQAGGNRSLAEHKSILIWQRYAEPIWTDIAQSDVLSHRLARAEHDERHISPLQLTVIRRCLQVWTNPGDIVLSPFAGIGSAGYVSIELGRRFVGAELKPSYYRQAVANLRLVENRRTPLF